MAKTVSGFPMGGKVSEYPWDQWLDGQIWELTEGKDFKSSAASFRQTASVAAWRRGVKAKTAIRGKTVYVQADTNGAKP